MSSTIGLGLYFPRTRNRTMEVQGYVLEGIPQLRCLSITEIVFGVMGTISILAIVLTSQSYGIGLGISGLLIAGLLLAAGSFGVHAVNKARSRTLDASTGNLFRICGILNFVLCALYGLELFLLVLGGILLAAAPNAGVALLAHLGIVARWAHSDEADFSDGATFRAAVDAMFVALLVFSIFICVLWIALTASAATIARENQAIIMAGPSVSGREYLASPPASWYAAVKTEETHA